jgi:hypothetical protein
MYQPMGNEEFATAYSETHTTCDCGATPLLPDMENADGELESIRCTCGTISCWDCMDVGGCKNPSCDRNADREER